LIALRFGTSLEDILYPPDLDETERVEEFLILLDFLEDSLEAEVVFSPRLDEELLYASLVVETGSLSLLYAYPL